MTENNRGFDGSHLEPYGLFRRGEHNDTQIKATSPNGDVVPINVHPLKVDGGTMFIPLPGQEGLRILFPHIRRKSI